MTTMLNPVIISAPFGNYSNLLESLIDPADYTPTVGTFTWEPRGFWTKPYGGRWLRTLLSVRYSVACRSWVNRIGLKNPGLRHYAAAHHSTSCDKIISIYGWDMQEWQQLITLAASVRPLAIEVNTSCPNVNKPPFTIELFEMLAKSNSPAIVKIPPVGYQVITEMAYASGIKTFHATNTLPTSRGGISGKALLPVALDVVRNLRRLYPDCTIIGGGGITSVKDVTTFLQAGANRVAVGSMLFNPFYIKRVGALADTVRQWYQQPVLV